MAFVGDTKSVFGSYLYRGLVEAFGEHYKYIFSPVMVLLGIFMFKEKDLHFNMYRFF